MPALTRSWCPRHSTQGDSNPPPQALRVWGPRVLAGTRNHLPFGKPWWAYLACLERAEKQSPESQGDVCMLSADLPPSSPSDYTVP